MSLSIIEIFSKTVPVMAVMVFGFFLKTRGFFTRDHGDFFMRIVYYIGIPSLIITSLSKIDLSADLLILPLLAVLLHLIIFSVSFTTGKLLKLNRPRHGSFLAGTMTMNNGYLFPFILLLYGETGFSRIIVFDMGNAIMAFTLVFYLANKFGRRSDGGSVDLKRVFLSPPLIAITFSLLFASVGMKLPESVNSFFTITGNLTIPLVLLGIGIFFSPQIVFSKELLLGILLRSGLGFVIGLLIVTIIPFPDLEQKIILISSAAPVGFNAITFASLEDMDKEFASSLVSFSILVMTLLFPLLIFFVEHMNSFI